MKIHHQWMRNSFGFLFLCLFVTTAVQAAPPPNDNFANRILLEGYSITTTANNADATREDGEPAHYSAASHSVWWTWTAPSSGTVMIDLCGSSFDATLAVYTGTVLTGLEQLTRNDDDPDGQCGLDSRVRFEAIEGVSYQIAVDSLGSGSGGSIVLHLTAPRPGKTIAVVPAGSVWKYLDNGSDAGSAWREVAFDDSTWASGPARLGYGGDGEATVVSYGPNSNSKYITTYFRHAFALTNASTYSNLVVRLIRDDGAVVHLNGTEVFRSNMPLGPVTATTAASGAVSGSDETAWFENSVPNGMLREGTNVLAVEIHQNNGTSSDLGFDLALAMFNDAPRVTLAEPTNNAVFKVPTNILLTALASDPEGAVTKVEFYSGAEKLGETSTAPYSFLWTNPPAGYYTLIARATDAAENTAFSQPVDISVVTNYLPVVRLTQPTNQAVFAGSTNITLVAEASDLDGSVVKVEFYANGAKLGEATQAPYGLVWTNAPTGWQTIQAAAIDNLGETGMSPPVSILVTSSADMFANRMPLTGAPIVITNSNLGTTREENEPIHGYEGNNSIWFSWTAPTNGSVVITAFSSEFTILMAVYTGNALTTLVPVASSAVGTSVSFGAVKDTQYQIAVDGYNGSSGEFTLRIEMVEPPPNDNFEERYTITGATAVIAGSNVGATRQPSEPLHGGSLSGPSVWWTWTAPSNCNARLTVSNSFFNIIMAAYTGSALDNLVLVASNSFQETFGFLASGGTTYHFAVDGRNGSSGPFSFHLATFTPPPNDFFTNAITIAGGTAATVTGSSRGATKEPGEPSHSGFSGGASVWWRWTAPAASSVRLSLAGSTLSSPLLAVYTGSSVSSLSSRASMAFGESLIFSATAGTTYYIAVDNYEGDGGDIVLSLNVPLVISPAGSTWRYSNTGVSQGTAWREPGFNDRSWASGVAPLGDNVESGVQRVTTTINIGPSGARYPTIYFRRAFVVNNPSFFMQLGARLMRDDGAIVYLNGVEIFRSNMPGGTVDYETFASSSVSGSSESSFFNSGSISASLLIAGTNFLAVEVHQSDSGSSDLAFDLELNGFSTNAPPTVSITSPANYTVYPDVTNITITATATANVGSLRRVEFFANGIRLGEDTNSPYRITWTNAPLGSHVLTAVATDSTGLSGTSLPVNISVGTPTTLVPVGSVWKYRDNGTDQGMAWREATFDDSTWAAGPAELGFGDGDEATRVNGGPSNNRYPTTYFRHSFVVANAASYSNLMVRLLRDDGGVVYLNGVEVFRSNMPDGPVTYETWAASATSTETTFFPMSISPFLLVDGTNVLAVEIHQNDPDSSDISFNLELTGNLPSIPNQAPLVSITSPTNGSSFYEPASIPITVSAMDPDGRITSVEVFVNDQSLGTLTNSPYRLTWTNVAAGSYTVTAVAADHLGLASSSRPLNITVNEVIPTVNDNFADRIVMPEFGTYTGSNLTGTKEPGEPDHAGKAGGKSAWWSWTALSNTVVRITTAGSTFDTLLAVYTGNAVNTLTLIASNDQDPLGGGGSRVTFTAVQGVTYHIAVDGANGTSGLITLNMGDNPPIIASIQPAPGVVTNLTAITVTFSRPVAGVDARDLMVNGLAAVALSGGGASYTFAFSQPAYGQVAVRWAANHSIADLATPPNPFDASAPEASWTYQFLDKLAPRVAALQPADQATVTALSEINVTFSEAVKGVNASDLLINGSAATGVSGSGAGPYRFRFPAMASGNVQVAWATGHGITDLAAEPNLFVGGQWSYQVSPSAVFADRILINEIMFNPPSGQVNEEWIELHNRTRSAANLTGWRFTRGIDFTFTNVQLPAGGYLVVAADPLTFQAKYPEITNVVGGWTGRLANNDETIELVDALGEVVDSVHYASEGDWALRERGRGGQRVTSITLNGNTATVNIFGHGYSASDRVMISGADQPEYNGLFTLSGITPSTFNITVPGSPAPATGNIICRQVIDNGSSGWSWFCPADGFGNSLELIHPGTLNEWGQSWLSSATVGGTPGRANSVLTTNVAPLIQEVRHFPAVPRSTEPISITARVQDGLGEGVQSVTLYYRDHTLSYGNNPPPFNALPMLDDGAHSDGVSGDHLYGAVLSPAANGTVIEFYVSATDTAGLTRTWPAPTWNTNNTYGQLANALLQVDDEVIPNMMPALRVIMTGTEQAMFPPPDRSSDAEMNATFISMDGDGTKVRYNCGVRVRGAGTRGRTPTNNRLNIPNDNRWNNLSAINLNGQYVHAALVGNVLAQKSGLPSTDARVVQYRINGVNPAPITAPINGPPSIGAGWGTFLLVEPVNGDLAADLYPEDPDGNVYRASTGNHNADLSYYGTDPNTYVSTLGRGYFKTSNQAENDWTDLFNLTYAFSQVGPDADYVEAISTNVNVREWMTYFAAGTLMSFGETALFNGRGDDYAMYRGNVDPRFVVFGHDYDTIFGQGDTTNSFPTRIDTSIFMMLNPPNPSANMPVLRRFMTNAAFAPIYYAELKRLCDTTFHPSQLNPLLDQLLTGWGVGPSAGTIANMKNFATVRRNVVLSQIPIDLTVNTTLPSQNGYLTTTTPAVPLSGTANAIDTRKILVNGSPANWSAWEARWTTTANLQPGINRVLVQALNSNEAVIASTTLDILYDDGNMQVVAGEITSDTIWSAENGPFHITGNLTVANGTTLTIQPGATVYLGDGVSVSVSSGGRLLAEGRATAPIRFARAPGTTATWAGIILNGGADTPESRIAYAHIEHNGDTAIHAIGATVFLDHLTFGTTDQPYLSLDGASFVVQDCVFPRITGSFEAVHGSAGIKSGGRGIFLRNFFGAATGYNDVVDFTGGNRPGPIVQFINNVFLGSGDDLLDLDSTDAWIEGNIFMHAHKNGSPDTASAVSGGADNAQTSQVTIIGNLIYDCDHAAMAKQGNFFTLINNTIVRQTRTGGSDTDAAVVCLADNGAAQGAGMHLEGNIIYDIEKLTRDVITATVTFTNNLMPLPWIGPGGNNSTADPLLSYVPQLSETFFTNWQSAQVMWEWFKPRRGSPAIGNGPNGVDQGGVIPPGIALSGESAGATRQNTAVLRVGNAAPIAGWPNGSGYTHYRWRLDGGAWSDELPITTPISLSGLANGTHYVEAIGRNDAGLYQNDPVLGVDAAVTRSRTWTVDPNASPLWLNEVLASNAGAVPHGSTTPDVIELYNATGAPVDLAGMRLTDDPQDPDMFIFPAGASIPANGYLIVYANASDGTPGYHLGFNLNQQGDAIYLYDKAENGGALLDSLSFGPQLTDYSIGRLANGAWALTLPTFDGANKAAPLGEPTGLRINEWLAIGQTPFANDFIELYNTDPLPVALGGLYISDEIIGIPNRHAIAPLSFIGGYGYLRLVADRDPEQGPDHLNFRLSAEIGNIGLFLPDLTPIDLVMYQPQRLNVSQGRSPNGGSSIVFFDQPTPGAPNPLIVVTPSGGALVINEVQANNATQSEWFGTNQYTPDWIELYNGTTNTVNLGDMSLTDDAQQPRRYLFTAGTQIAPGGFLRFFCENREPASTNNTGFGLSANSGSVYLFDAPGNGGSLLSAITYGLQVADLSIGRVPDGSTNWVLTSPTPETANAAVLSLGNPAALRINEWLAAPDSGDDWLELYNPATQPVALGGLYLTDDLNNRTKHRIAPLSYIGTGTNAWILFIADGNTGAGADHVGFSLRAAGEALGLSALDGTLLNGITFGTQQTGISEGRFPDGATNIVRFPGTASPGESNYRWLTDVAINEVLTHTDAPLEDAIELRNLTDQSIDVGGWWLSDDTRTLQKYQIPTGTLLPANGYLVFYENTFSNRDMAAIAFSLSSKGDEVVLSAAANGALTGYRKQVKFGAAENGVSFGRHVTSDQREEFVALSARTFGHDNPASLEDFRLGTGASNAYPRVGPVVFNEIMYHPPQTGATDNVLDEYLELLNITAAPIAFYDPAHPTNTWRLRSGVDFDFPGNVVLPAGGYLLVVPFDPVTNVVQLVAFRTKYGVAPSVPVLGPYQGKLDNGGETVALYKPDAPETETGFVPYILVESISYSDDAPWPVEADGGNASLQRLDGSAFGNDPANWIAARATAGQGYLPNTPPRVLPINPQVVQEFRLLTLNVVALDSNMPPQQLTFSLDPGAPPRASISSDGVFRWRPLEEDGGQEFNVTVRVTDDGIPPLSGTQTFTIAVPEVNWAPAFVGMRERHVKAGSLLTFPTAIDRDLPVQHLSCSLGGGAPSGCTVDPNTGIFQWTPTDAQAPGTYTVTIQATDDGSPTLSATETYTIHVWQRSDTLVVAEFTTSGNSLRLDWQTTAGKTYQVLYKDALASPTWTKLEGGSIPPGGNIVATGPSLSIQVPMSGQRFFRLVQMD